MTITSKTQPLRGLIQTTSYAVSEPLTNITHEFFNKASKEAALDYVIHRNITGSDLVKDESSNHEKQYLSYIIPAAYNAWQELWNTVNPHMKKMIEWKIGNDASNWGYANGKAVGSNYGCTIIECSEETFTFEICTGKGLKMKFHFDIDTIPYRNKKVEGLFAVINIFKG